MNERNEANDFKQFKELMMTLKKEKKKLKRTNFRRGPNGFPLDVKGASIKEEGVNFNRPPFFSDCVNTPANHEFSVGTVGTNQCCLG
ncbi:hypothetical protein RUM43_012369 [Polyplax serrata]|uniref:Uncharacterized protein n=1 Tax=Polyplax serrata TaxID=468196 RepID=A0AAN8P7C8_POLSC